MEWFALIVPIVLSLLGLFIFRHKLVWWEVLLPTGIAIIVIAIMKVAMINSLTNDTEYWSEYITEARYYEDWNEYIHRTCTRTVSCGKNCTRTETYDCSYVSYHREYWEIRTNIGNRYNISESYFNNLVKLFGNKKFVDLHRSYHTNDGDMYKTDWNREFETIKPMTLKMSYENKPQAVSSVFKFRELDSIQKIGLYDYPEVIDRTQNACLGCNENDNLFLRRNNALWGHKYEIKVYILLFDNKSVEIAERQRSYWKGGNKNELVICLDRSGKWSRTFSWCDNKEIEVRTNEIFNREGISLKDKIKLLKDEINHDWKRKDFSDFDYIKVPLTSNQHIWIFIIVTLVSIGALIFGIKNDIEQ